MKFYGKAEQTATTILNAFQTPEQLPAALAPIFIHRDGSIPCRNWSWNNQIIALLNGTADARGYRQWQEAGRQVKKGSKAFHILVPCAKKIEDEETGEAQTRVYGFTSAPVFRFQDTEGDPLPVNHDASDYLDNLPLREVAEAWGLSLDVYDGSGAPFLGFYRHGVEIQLGVKNLATFFHELVHAADDKLGALSRKQQWGDEVVAELGGAIIAKMLGLDVDADLGGAYDYIKRYAGKANKCPVSAAMQLLSRTCDAVNLILVTADSIGARAEVAA